MIKVKAQVRGVREMQRRLRIVRRRIKHPLKANRNISIWLQRWVNQNFKTEGGKVGRWKPFKHGGRRIKGGGIDKSAKLLQRTGTLRASFKGFYTSKMAGIGTDLSYAKYHEFGVPRNRLPSRRMLPLNTDKEVIQAATKIYHTYIKRALR